MNQPIADPNPVEENVGFILSPVWYDRFRLFVQVLLPGIGALYFGLAGIWGLPKAEQVTGTCAVIAVFLGLLLGVSRRRRDVVEAVKEQRVIDYLTSDERFDGTIVPQVDGGGVRGYSLELKGDPEELQYKSEITFKVTPVDVA